MSAEPTLRPNRATARRRLKARDLPYPARLGILLAAYFITAKLGLLMDAVSGFATTVWPPTGISLVALALFGYRLWPGVAMGAFLVNFSAGAPFLAAAGMATGNTLEALVGTYLLRRFAGFRGSLDRVSSVVGFVVLAAGFSTMLSATIGVMSGWLGGVIPPADFGKAWWTWWLGDAMGDLIVAPLLFALFEQPRAHLSARRLVEGGALFASLVIVSLIVFGGPFTPERSSFLQPYLVFPFLFWAAIRFGQPGTVTTTFVVAGVAIWKTAQGVGPFAGASVNESLLLLQAFMGVVAVTMLVFAGGVSERRRAEMRVKVNYSVARVLADPPSLEEVFPGILRAICEGLGWDYGNAWKVDVETNTLRHAAQWDLARSRAGDFGKTAGGVTLLPGIGLAGRAWRDRRPFWAPNLDEETNFVRRDLVRELGLRSAMGFPILLGKEVHGVMTFFSRKIHEPDDALLQVMATIGSQIGQFFQRRRAESDLRQAHAELEARIARRTEQLWQTNLALQEEIAERKHAEKSMRQLSTRLLRVQDEERRRLARELHDSTAQSLAALSINLAVAQGCRAGLDERARIALDEGEALAERCSREIRSLSYLLHPPLLEEVGLPAALRWCAEGFARRSGISVELEIPADFGRLPEEVENALFRIVQECLTNVYRHSGSPTARIQLVRGPRCVALEVRDQGRGMPPETLSRQDGVESLGVGLLGMRERVRQLGGHLRIDSSVKGAMVQVEIDVPPEGS